MRLHATSAGLEPAALTPGSDLVLDADPTHGVDLPAGTLVDDYLDLEARREVERTAAEVALRWRERMDPELTVEGLCLPLVWEFAIFHRVSDAVLKCAGMLGALEAHGPASLTLSGGDRATELLVDAVAEANGLAVTEAAGGADATPTPTRRVPPARRVRHAALAPARAIGIPSRLRAGSILFVSYWPLEPLLDRMLAQRGEPRPAVFLDKLPSRPRRALRAAGRGGWIGTPGPRHRSWAARAAERALGRSSSEAPAIDAYGVAIGAAAHEAIMTLARERAVPDLARARLLRRVFERARPAGVLSAWDSDPDARLVISVAKEAGVPTFVLSHGAYLQPTLLRDMNFGDEILLWSEAMERPAPPDGTPVHVVGYPLPHAPPPENRCYTGSPDPPTIVVIAQPALAFPLIDRRIEMRHYLTAIDAILARAPSARIVLRPHPERGRGAALAAAERREGANVEIDAGSPIMELLADCDVCIGTASAATLQAALVGTPVIALNLNAYDWLWPLGGGTRVPLARSGAELTEWLGRWLGGERLPGQEELLEGLGANGGDASARMLDVLAARTSGRAAANGEGGVWSTQSTS
jgi:hypothetical protein